MSVKKRTDHTSLTRHIHLTKLNPMLCNTTTERVSSKSAKINQQTKRITHSCSVGNAASFSPSNLKYYN